MWTAILCFLVIVVVMLLNIKMQQNDQKKLRDNWIGHHKSEILREWGPPTGGIVNDGQGGEILTYNQGTTNFRSRDIGGPTVVTQTSWCHVYLDKDQLIYDMKWATT